MIFEYGKGPMHNIDGVPAFKFGEWPGVKSCKFQPTRRIIRPQTEGIIFNDNEPPLQPKKKVHIYTPSEEKLFKPCLKMVARETDKKPKIESIKIIRPMPKSEIVERPKRDQYFKYKEDHVKDLMHKVTNQETSNIIKQELKYMTKIGFTKKVLDNISNTKLLGINFNYSNQLDSPRSVYNNKKKNILNSNIDYRWQKKEQEMMNNIKIEQDNLFKDIHYVKTLNDWDKKILPKIK